VLYFFYIKKKNMSSNFLTNRFPLSRLGIAIAQPPLIQILTNTKAPYNISTPTAQIALSALSSPALAVMKSKLFALNTSRTALLSTFSSLAHLGLGPSIGGNDANFILIPILEKGTDKPDSERAHKVYKALAEENGVVVRYRGNEPGCKGCLRITVGNDEENEIVLEKLQKVLKVL
jgi:histidinol-phosphate aminotransferase